MDSPKDWPTEEEAQENQKKDLQKFKWIGVGFSIAFFIFLVIGLLDKYGLLE